MKIYTKKHHTKLTAPKAALLGFAAAVLSAALLLSCGNVLGLAFLPDPGNGSGNGGNPGTETRLPYWRFLDSFNNLYGEQESPRRIAADTAGNFFIDDETNMIRLYGSDGNLITSFENTSSFSPNANFVAYSGAAGPGLCFPIGTSLNNYEAPGYVRAERSFAAGDIGAPAIDQLFKAIR